MTNEDLEDKYPHWRDALFGNHNAVANLRCAVEYTFWHAIYIMIAFAGAVIVGTLKVSLFVAQYLGPLAGPVTAALKRVYRGVSRVAHNDRVTSIAAGAVVVIGIIVLLISVGSMLWYFLQHPFEGLLVFGGTVLLAVGCLVLFALLDRYGGRAAGAIRKGASVAASGARTAGETATKTPGVRRVYGNCPVSFGQPPKWFTRLFPEDDDI